MKIIVESQSYLGLIVAAEKAVYEAALRAVHENQTMAAKLVGVSRGTFRTKLRKYFGNKYFRN